MRCFDYKIKFDYLHATRANALMCTCAGLVGMNLPIDDVQAASLSLPDNTPLTALRKPDSETSEPRPFLVLKNCVNPLGDDMTGRSQLINPDTSRSFRYLFLFIKSAHYLFADVRHIGARSQSLNKATNRTERIFPHNSKASAAFMGNFIAGALIRAVNCALCGGEYTDFHCNPQRQWLANRLSKRCGLAEDVGHRSWAFKAELLRSVIIALSSTRW